jgi:hypothetical protein
MAPPIAAVIAALAGGVVALPFILREVRELPLL